MAGTVVSSSINTFSDHAAQSPVKILPDGRSIGGILEKADAVGGGLIHVSVSGREYLVDDSLQEKLAALMGQHMTVVRVFGRWGCGAMPL
jgi:hypothetical protein